jgi:hypothetical protein
MPMKSDCPLKRATENLSTQRKFDVCKKCFLEEHIECSEGTEIIAEAWEEKKLQKQNLIDFIVGYEKTIELSEANLQKQLKELQQLQSKKTKSDPQIDILATKFVKVKHALQEFKLKHEKTEAIP